MSNPMSNWKLRFLKSIFNRHMRWRIKELLSPEYPVLLEYPICPKPRYGYGKPPHPEIEKILSRNEDGYSKILTELHSFTQYLTEIPETETPDSPGEPYWSNAYFSGMDAIALYGLLGSRKPSKYFEVGSGNSTKFARRAVRDLNLATEIISLDPFPRAEVDALCNRTIRQPLEEVDIAIFDELGSGDILFIDNSHRVFQNSDVTVFFLEILPRLKPGLIVHIHDIFLPFDYPQSWVHRHYSEQYLLAAYLLAEFSRIDVLLPLAYICRHETLSKSIKGDWPQPLFQDAFSRYGKFNGDYAGISFWLIIK